MQNIIRHRPRRERDGSFAVMRITILCDGDGNEIRRSEAIETYGLPNRRLAGTIARAMRHHTCVRHGVTAEVG